MAHNWFRFLNQPKNQKVLEVDNDIDYNLLDVFFMPGTVLNGFYNIILFDAYRNSRSKCFIQDPVIKTKTMICQTKRINLQGICYTLSRLTER